jgi:hypothetical protein
MVSFRDTGINVGRIVDEGVVKLLRNLNIISAIYILENLFKGFINFQISITVSLTQTSQNSAALPNLFVVGNTGLPPHGKSENRGYVMSPL